MLKKSGVTIQNNLIMKTLAAILVFFMSVINTSQATALTYVYCGLPDGSDWDWLLDEQGNYISIEGQWRRVSLHDSSFFNVFNVEKATFDEKNLDCPSGYNLQPADRNTSYWEVFQITLPNGSTYFMDGHKSYHNTSRHQSHYLRSL